ncbi:hypothetical protein VDGL01_10828 [Verticillium dahliae]
MRASDPSAGFEIEARTYLLAPALGAFSAVPSAVGLPASVVAAHSHPATLARKTGRKEPGARGPWACQWGLLTRCSGLASPALASLLSSTRFTGPNGPRYPAGMLPLLFSIRGLVQTEPDQTNHMSALVHQDLAGEPMRMPPFKSRVQLWHWGSLPGLRGQPPTSRNVGQSSRRGRWSPSPQVARGTKDILHLPCGAGNGKGVRRGQKGQRPSTDLVMSSDQDKAVSA